MLKFIINKSTNKLTNKLLLYYIYLIKFKMDPAEKCRQEMAIQIRKTLRDLKAIDQSSLSDQEKCYIQKLNITLDTFRKIFEIDLFCFV